MSYMDRWTAWSETHPVGSYVVVMSVAMAITLLLWIPTS